MEAIGLYNFSAKEKDELTFTKGAHIKILNMEEDPNWYSAECGMNVGLVPANYIELLPNPWYVPYCSRIEAEAKLHERNEHGKWIQEDGAYLVRQSVNNRGSFSLSVKNADEVIHFRILCSETYQFSIWKKLFPSINKLIEYHKTHSVCKEDQPKLFLKDRIQQNARQPLGGNYVAQYDFIGMSMDELSFKHGDVIMKIGEEDNNWWIGELKGRKGIFPCNYVQKMN